MPNDELLDRMQGLLQLPFLYPETQHLIELAIEAQKKSVIPGDVLSAVRNSARINEKAHGIATTGLG